MKFTIELNGNYWGDANSIADTMKSLEGWTGSSKWVIYDKNGHKVVSQGQGPFYRGK